MKNQLITRTIEITYDDDICLNTDTAEVTIETHAVPGERIDDANKLLKLLKTLYETDTFKLVAIQNITHTSKLYGVVLPDFLDHAIELPPRGVNNDD